MHQLIVSRQIITETMGSGAKREKSVIACQVSRTVPELLLLLFGKLMVNTEIIAALFSKIELLLLCTKYIRIVDGRTR